MVVVAGHVFSINIKLSLEGHIAIWLHLMVVHVTCRMVAGRQAF